jgi:sugar O-acyltransferase (sialic acid O-acetyltransferase NeuD family)
MHGLPILGGMDWLIAQEASVHVVIGIGSPAVKRQLVERMRSHVAGFPTLVHPTAVRSDSVQMGEGTVVAAGNILTVDIRLGAFVTLNLSCTVGHDAVLDDYVTVAPGATISGNVRVGEGCDVGTGSSTVQGTSIGEWSIVGAGAVVSKSLPANCTAVGVPAKPIKERPVGWHLGT